MFGWFKKKGRKFGGSHIVVTPSGGVSRKGFNQFDVMAASLDWKYDLNDPCILEICDQIINSTSLDHMINQTIVDSFKEKLQNVVTRGYFHLPTTVNGVIRFNKHKVNTRVIKCILNNTYTRLV